MTTNGKEQALITGASAGLGAAFARELAGRGMDLVLTARRQERLEELARELEARHGTKSLIVAADLARPEAPGEIFEAAVEAGIELDLLVNNAGYGIEGTFLECDWQRHADFIQVMVTSVVQLTWLVLPGMIERRRGRVIQVASLAALAPGAPGFPLYAPSKSFLLKMAETLSHELAGTGVSVTATCPGFTHTEFHDVVGNREEVSKLPDAMWMEADEVARGAVESAMRGEVIHVPGGFNRALATVSKLLPHKLGLKMAGAGSRKADEES